MIKKTTFTSILLLIVITICNIPALCAEESREVLRYSCSDQVLFAFERERLIEFSRTSDIDIDLNVAPSGSVADFVFKGLSDIASTNQALTRSQKESGGIEIPFCRDAMTIITNEDCPIDNLTSEQVTDIFSGKTLSWKQVGGSDQPIIVVAPMRATGAYKFFQQMIMKGPKIKCDMVAYRSWMIIEMIKANFPHAISFITNGALAEYNGIKTIRVDGLEPTNPDYPYFQTFYFVTKGESRGPVKLFIDFAKSEKGRSIMKKRGMIPIP
jgi:phosphate transport system substrate-binding protein